MNTAPTFTLGDGVVFTNIGSSGETGKSVKLQSDGKILVAGYYNGDFALLRYNSDGSLDDSFSDDGWVTTDIRSGGDEAYSVAVQADGKILVAGDTYNDGYSFALVELNRLPAVVYCTTTQAIYPYL